MNSDQNIQWHSLWPTAVLKLLKSSTKGISSKEASEGLKKEGRNTLVRRAREGFLAF